MGRGPKPTKGDAKPVIPRKSRANEDSKVRDFEKRLAEALKLQTEAQEQQAATSEILRVISRSQTDVQPVFDAMLQSAVHLLGGFGGTINLIDGDLFRLAAVTGGRPQSGDENWFRSLYPRPLDPDQPLGRAIRERRMIQIPDTDEDLSERLLVAFSSGLS